MKIKHRIYHHRDRKPVTQKEYRSLRVCPHCRADADCVQATSAPIFSSDTTLAIESICEVCSGEFTEEYKLTGFGRKK